MEYLANVENSEIDVSGIRTVLVQGDSSYPVIRFVLDPSLTGLSWRVRGTYLDTLIPVLSPEIIPVESESSVILDWSVSSDFTTYFGDMQLVVVGANDSGAVITKALGEVTIQRDYSIGTMAEITLNLFEQLMAQLPSLVNHNDFNGIQGGSENERYHLTAAEHTVIENTSGINTGDQDVSGAISTHNNDAGAHAGVVYQAASVAFDIEKLNDKLNDYRESVTPIKNCIKSVVAGYVVSVSIGSVITFSSNAGYGYAIAPVDELCNYSVNMPNYNNNFSVVCDKNGIILGRLRDYYADGQTTVYLMPENAETIYLCTSDFSVAGNNNAVVIKTSDVITGQLDEYNVINYPLDTVVKTTITNQFDESRGEFTDAIMSRVPDEFEPFINSCYYQYIDKTKWMNGYYWYLSGTIQKITNASYKAYPAFELLSGPYRVVNCSGNFSYAQYSDNTIHKFADIVVNGVLYLPQDSKVYVSNSDITYTMVIDGEVPTDEAGVTVFETGKFDISSKHIIYCGSKRKYNTLRKAIDKATEYFDCTVYVDAETFDLAVEFADELETYDGTNEKEGITLKNRVHVIFASGAKVVFDYAGENEFVYSCFSPFNAGEYGFTLENAWIESQNCRYAVHDEMNSTTKPYFNHYKNCTIIHGDSVGWGPHQAIGGGLGCHGHILIENCYCECEAVDGYTITYHNAASLTETDVYNRIDIKGCYIVGTFRVSNYGIGTRKSQAYCSGNSFTSAPECQTTITESRLDNMELIEWNNEVRI